MIVVTRLTGAQFGVNPDLIQRVDSAPDTILTLVDGTKYIVAEPMLEVIARVNEHRAALLARSYEMRATPHIELVPEPEDDEDDDDAPLAQTLPLRPRSV
ncbi:flagellar FlbD family protein [Cellulomonas edaphi]|uniref:Flagellar FlbD family protein n=1 Tax=Cellulomonas edaphi TaxID=3053468 RepID=A0ABT7S4L1_9CELL|nr:flagellar FlbD family protein [Cellulomons edaphi]MDM7830552.1 flagellar FlbD family protein [Cellulomons edaphi]